MDVNRIIRTQVTTGELAPPTELVNGMSCLPKLRLQRICRRSCPGVNDGSVPLINVVKGLGEYLTSTEDDTRLKGQYC